MTKVTDQHRAQAIRNTTVKLYQLINEKVGREEWNIDNARDGMDKIKNQQGLMGFFMSAKRDLHELIDQEYVDMLAEEVNKLAGE